MEVPVEKFKEVTLAVYDLETWQNNKMFLSFSHFRPIKNPFLGATSKTAQPKSQFKERQHRLRSW